MRRLILMLLIAAGLAACNVIMGDGNITQDIDKRMDVGIPDPRNVEPLRK